MGAFKPDLKGLNSYLSLKDGLRVPMRINFDAFFDRDKVIQQIGAQRARALTRAGLKVKQTAAKSIKKKGMAKPKLEEQNQFPTERLAAILNKPEISDRRKKAIARRIVEIRRRDPSDPGTPPHTHTGMMRNNIVFAYDKSTDSVVVGGFMSGGAWLMSLHEFGGSIRQHAWTWIPRYPNPKTGILLWLAPNKSPRQTEKWQQTSFSRTAAFPKRPYMEPALKKCVASGAVVGSFRIGGLGQ